MNRALVVDPSPGRGGPVRLLTSWVGAVTAVVVMLVVIGWLASWM
jgi:hypothetical protein